jgi:ketosteroid isomerase-like protein
MPQPPEHRREVLAHLFADLATGSGATLRAACAPDVTWWLPTGAGERQGVADVEGALLATFAQNGAELQSVVLGADGRTAVLEHLLHPEGGGPTPATSVLTLSEDRVVAGRTYLDVAAWGGPGTVDHA